MAGGQQDRRKHRYLIWLGVAAGTLLAVIGLRFMIVPRTAANNFGLAKELAGYELHLMVGLRDLWLGGLAVVFALLREWRALMWWFALGAIVCFADAAIAAYSSGKIANVLFHLVSGAFCVGLAVQLARLRTDG
ncbi:MAG: DUF4267 domain-containing protein [Hyphomicrobiaceae bacterium]|nr:DUF4267 domain-containing protein [Hyphomicrobiaceae bacterium]